MSSGGAGACGNPAGLPDAATNALPEPSSGCDPWPLSIRYLRRHVTYSSGPRSRLMLNCKKGPHRPETRDEQAYGGLYL